MKYEECPCCGVTPNFATFQFGWVQVCPNCGAMFGVAPSYQETLKLVKSKWDDKDPEIFTEAYYDFMFPINGEAVRRHGWFNPATGCITQTG